MVEHKVDDLNGEEDPTIEAVRFLAKDKKGNEGVYELDLGKENRDAYEEFIAAHQAKARLIGALGRIKPPELPGPKGARERKPATRTANGAAAKPSGTAAAPRRDREESKNMREWARAHGWPELSDRGRPPAEVVEAYNNAMAATV
jgi:hypothetical protein